MKRAAFKDLDWQSFATPPTTPGMYYVCRPDEPKRLYYARLRSEGWNVGFMNWNTAIEESSFHRDFESPEFEWAHIPPAELTFLTLGGTFDE